MNSNSGPPFYGKYRGIVTDNQDKFMQGRVRARVPDIFGENDSGWAMPCSPYGGDGVGLFLIPPKDARVWIEFEHGDPEYPIWSGCFWARGKTPVVPALPDKKVLKTDSAVITLDDTPGAGGITIETAAGMKVVINSKGIEIDNGQNAKIKLSGPKVSINDTALEVT
jgi:uncharacterized protein involved in type VI secretion and phage assembly